MVYTSDYQRKRKKSDTQSYDKSPYTLKENSKNKVIIREKRTDLTQSYVKSPNTPKENSKNKVISQKLHQNFDYTTIADPFRSWINETHPTGVWSNRITG